MKDIDETPFRISRNILSSVQTVTNTITCLYVSFNRILEISMHLRRNGKQSHTNTKISLLFLSYGNNT